MGQVKELSRECLRIAQAHGFHISRLTFGKPNDILATLMLVTTEVAEAAEDVRHGNQEHFGEELADICIRVFNIAEDLNIDLEDEIIRKMAKNEKREYLHGGKNA